jgi:hypothetical protein
MLFYRAALPLSSRTLTYLSGIIRRHRKGIGSRWRKLNAGRQALLLLAYLRKGETFADLGAGFGVGTSTAWRYANETVALLATRAPRLRKAVREAKKKGYAYVVLDGTLIPVDRVAADRPFHSGKHKKHGMNLQVIASPNGGILWGLRAGARQEGRVDLGCPGRARGRGPDRPGRQGLPGRRARESPVQGQEQARIPEGRQQGARETSRTRRARERAQLKNWHILRKLRCCPWRAGQLAKAIHALEIHAA